MEFEEFDDVPPVQTDFVVNEDGSITVDEITIPPAPAPALTNEAVKDRLIIKELIVHDFKSYAGTHTIGPFNKNFSCIVGPNGSGKSNVIDALLFVFGYRAQKIRSKKVSVLIHKSHKFPNLQSCSVSVKFVIIKDEGTNFSVIPESEFMIKRTGYMDNSSSYEINGRRSNYKDVTNLLRGYGIDLDYNRFMILQGEIELISMMKPKAPTEQDTGMLEYIEDIIGSNRFIQPIQHFSSKVEKMNELRIERLNQLKIVEKERAEAEKPCQKALEYVQLANEVTMKKNMAIQAQLCVAEKEKNEIMEKKNTLSEKIQSASGKMEEIQACKEIKESELKTLMYDYETYATAAEELKQQFTDLERQDVACRENIKSTKEKMKKIAKDIEAEETRIESMKKQLHTHEAEKQELEAKKEKVEQAKGVEEEKLNKIMGSLKGEIQGFQEEQDVFEAQLVKLKSIVDEKQSELNLKESELDLVLSSEMKAKKALEALEEEHQKNLLALEEEKRVLKEAGKTLPQLENKLLSSKKTMVDLEKKEVNLSEEIQSKRIKLDEMKTTLSASQSRSTLVKAFMEQKKLGKLTGVLGRLGDLGAIDEKYNVAISTACGALDNIVTDTVETAEACVEFLKKNNLGYATFIGLDKMEKWKPYTKEKINAPESVPRLFDLIKVKNEEVLPAFYFALRDTLVAKDLEQATRVGFRGSQRYRVVTLKGELVDLSGTMSGGGGRVMKDRMGQAVVSDSKASEKDIENLTAELESLSQEVIEARKCRQELKESIEETEREISKLQTSIKKSKSNYDAYLKSTESFTSQVEEQRKKIKAAAPDKNKIKSLESEIEEKRKNFSKASKEAALIEEKIKVIQGKILAVTKGKIANAQSKVDKLSKEVSTVSDCLVKATNLIKKTEKTIQKSENKISSWKQEIEECMARKSELLDEFNKLGEKGIEVNEKKNEAQKHLEEFEAKKKALSKELHEFNSQVHLAKSELIELKNQLKMIELEIKAKNSHVLGFKSELSKLEMYQVENEAVDLPALSPEEIAGVNINSLYMEIGSMENQMKGMNPDLGAITEFKKKDKMYQAKLKDLEDTVAQRDHYKQHYEQLCKCRMDEFMKGFNIVSLKVKELYQMITLGGDAELELVDSLDPFSEGIEFSVRPLRKSWKSIRNLSGGEKTLSSLALVFALHYYRSTPFFVMDEIDAALDFRNVSIIGCYIKECTKNAQFIVISLRENMFQLADHLVGIFKTNNRTKNVALKASLLSRFSKLEESFRLAPKEKSNPQTTTRALESHGSENSQKDSPGTTSEGSQVEDSPFDRLLSGNAPEKTVTFQLNPEEKENVSIPSGITSSS